MMKISLIGKTFGRLTAISELPKTGRDFKYLCVCVCGNRKSINARHLRSGGSRSCGCLQNEVRIKNGRDQRRKDRRSVLLHGLFAKFKNDAAKRRIENHLSFDVFSALSLSDCEYCGQSPSNSFTYSFTREKILYNGIDRVDNSVNYVEGNVVSCCWRCNSSKNDDSMDVFKDWISRVYMKTIKNSEKLDE